ncbi:MAG TPA: nuclear transport factor 2 family protein [Vicinamibacteria bacterium]|nr:nuclear transport factor 2 family protein [Vicinamibacteria bacterium]
MNTVLLALLAAASEDLFDRFREIEAERSRALQAADLPAIERLYADDFVGISATGDVIRKRELVENIRHRGASDVTFTAEELEARQVGEVALVLGRIVGRDAGGAVVREGRFLHVYREREGQWKLVAATATPIVP